MDQKSIHKQLAPRAALTNAVSDHGRYLDRFRGVDQARREEREHGGEPSDEVSARARPFYGG